MACFELEYSIPQTLLSVCAQLNPLVVVGQFPLTRYCEPQMGAIWDPGSEKQQDKHLQPHCGNGEAGWRLGSSGEAQEALPYDRQKGQGQRHKAQRPKAWQG